MRGRMKGRNKKNMLDEEQGQGKPERGQLEMQK